MASGDNYDNNSIVKHFYNNKRTQQTQWATVYIIIENKIKAKRVM